MRATAPIALYVINFILIGGVSLVAAYIMFYWNYKTGGSWNKIGTWRRYPSGRSMMGLLGIIHVITLNAAIQGLIPLPLEIKAGFYFGLYLIFMYSLAKIGFNIRDENRKDNRK